MHSIDARELGKYRIVETLGSGGFATVYRAHDTLLKRDVALKIMHPALMADRSFVTRFENDARAAAQLDHPHIVTIYELGQLESRLYIAMQFLSGGTLHARVEQEGTLPLDDCVQIVEQVAGALDHAHAAGFVHRDVKPTNILFDGQDTAILTDFGLVTVAEKSVIALSTAGGVIGTPAYIPPEVWEGNESSPATDVYALGCVVFEMLTGDVLFTGDTAPAAMMSHFQPRQYPEEWPAGVPARIEDVLERALAQNPADRFQRAGEFAQALDAVADEADDPLYEQYRELRAAVAGEAWDRALDLARDIAAENPEYRDVQTLLQAAVEGQAQAEQARWAKRWRRQAHVADEAGNVDAARAAAHRWLEFAPEDPDAKAMVARLDREAASEPTDDEEPTPQPERDEAHERTTAPAQDARPGHAADERTETQGVVDALPTVLATRLGAREWSLLGLGLVLVFVVLVGRQFLGTVRPEAMDEPAPTTVVEEDTVADDSMDETTSDSETGVSLPVVDPHDVTGAIGVNGSATVVPVVELLVAQFHDEGFSDESFVVPTDTETGFRQLCLDGATQIAAADRAYTEEEVAQCIDNGFDLVEFRIGTDAAVVIANVQNDWVDGLSKDEGAALFTDAVGWSDVRMEWPGDAVARFVPPADSRSFDLFANAILDGNRDRLLSAERTGVLDDDHDVAYAVIEDPHAIGFQGAAHVLDFVDEVRVLSIEGVDPTTDTVESGEYLLARPLHLYTTATIMHEQPQIAAFINYVLQHANEALLDVGQVPLSDTMLDSVKQHWLDVMATE